MKAIGVCLVTTSILATTTSACDLCSLYSATQAQGEVGKGFSLGLAEQFTHFGTVQVEGHKVANDANQYFDSSISQVVVAYNFNDRVGVQLNLPVIYRTFRRPDGLGGIDQGRVSGIGDLSLVGNWIPYAHETRRFSFRWSLLGGVKFPSGNTSRIAEEFVEIVNPIGPPSGIHGHDLTLGTGSVDGLVGTGVLARWHRCFATAGLQYSIRRRGDHDYQFANDLVWAGGPGVLLALSEKHSLGLQAVASGEHKGLDTFRGADAEDTGVTSVYLGPQINFTWSDKWSANAGVDIPASIDNTAFQTVPDYRVRAGLIWRF
jgi:hypothetical protein